MIRSMTGFGNAVTEHENKTLTVEIKSVNSKFFDLSLRFPSAYKDKDLELRTAFSRNGYPFFVMINAEGRRFVDEGADFRNYTYAKYGRIVLQQPGSFAWHLAQTGCERRARCSSTRFFAPHSAQVMMVILGLRIRPFNGEAGGFGKGKSATALVTRLWRSFA